MGKTLYLNESQGLSVRRDGPSILIKQPDKAVQRIPARLVGRVVILGNVRLEAKAITLFTENAVPVVFMDRSGEEVAVAIPYNHRLSKHYEEQKIFLESTENSSRFEHWAAAKRMVLQINMLNRLLKNLEPEIRQGMGDGNYQIIISELKPKDEERWALVSSAVTNIFRGMIIEHLIKTDLDPHMGVIHRRHNFGFALDICHVIGAESDLQSLQFFRSSEANKCVIRDKGKLLLTEGGMRNIIQRFENRLAFLENTVDIIIDEIFELIRELRT